MLSAPHGQFDLSKITTPSGLLAFFDQYDGELAVPDNPTYSVVDLSTTTVSEAVFEKLWPELFAAYGLRRLKGCFVNDRGERRHIEATQHQIEIRHAHSDEAVKIVLIGERADEITRDILQAQILMYGG